ncbi:Periplasmic binding domain-containing protein [Desulfonema limicola]|uniref:Periplasmic binding domain-containing protein n=1 Tax=Desulfonema limicola TaxID=45656 RepID=A0A975B5T3_9BACT|nr:substrate-binding domain-containing protein [Desulfonema limicola]QTA79311.1 Periplasmic binding domain-containing protein [Desulfonema limicola]
MKKINVILIALVFFCVFLKPVMAEKIHVVGTGSGMYLLRDIAEQFNKNNLDIKIIVPESIGSGGGIKSVGADQFLIGRVARDIKEKEKHFNLTYQPFAKLPVVFFLHRGTGVTDLSPRQICDIYSGKITNWQEVGGINQKIRIIRREPGDSSLEVLTASFPGFKDIEITSKSKTTFSDQETIKLAEKTKGTIAFGTYGDAIKYDVDILSINSIKPFDAAYPYTGTIALIYKEKNNIGNIRKFTDFIKTPVVKDIVKKSGGLPF